MPDFDTATITPKLRTITLELIRKRSEHNECLVSTLEEIALHQEELESIGSILGRTCGKTLSILLLQNNVISKLAYQDLKFLKKLTYLNLALNNVSKIEGLGNCECLEKLDLTLNFIDVDTLEESMENLRGLKYLKELYLLGNPCFGTGLDSDKEEVSCSSGSNGRQQQQDSKKHDEDDEEDNESNEKKKKIGWDGCRMYVISMLQQLKTLDGKEVKRSERIMANQRHEELTSKLRVLAVECANVKKSKSKRQNDVNAAADGRATTTGGNAGFENQKGDGGGEEVTEHTPEVRAEISREMAQQKSQKEEQERSNQPKNRGEKEFQEEQSETARRERERKENGTIRQCNEGKLQFHFDEEKRPGFVLLDVAIQKHLSSTLIDVDINPKYVSIVIKSKVLRLMLPAEVKVEESTAQRSTTTGHLLLSMPKVDVNENIMSIRAASRAKELNKNAATKAKRKSSLNQKNKGLASQMLQECSENLKGSVRIHGLVKRVGDEEEDTKEMGMKHGVYKRGNKVEMNEISTVRKNNPAVDYDKASKEVLNDDDDDDDGPPPIF